MTNLRIFLILVVGVLFYCYEFFLRILTGAYQEQIVSHFSLNTHTSFSFLVSSYNITYLLMQIPAGIILDRFGSKIVLICAMLLCGIGNIVFVAGGYELAIVGRLMIGVGSSFAFIGVLKLIIEHINTKYFALLTSLVISFGTLSAAFSQQISVYIQSYDMSWISLFIYVGLLAIPLAIVFYLVLPQISKNIQIMPDMSKIYKYSKSLLTNKAIWTNSLWAGLIYIPTVVLTSQYGLLYFKNLYHADAQVSTRLISSLFLGWVICSPFVSIVMKKLESKLLIYIGIVGMLLVSIAVLYLKASISIDNLAILMFVFGCLSSVQVLVWHYFNKICPSNISGLGIAVTNMIITLVTEIGQLGVGTSMDIGKMFGIATTTVITYCFFVFIALGFVFIRYLQSNK